LVKWAAIVFAVAILGACGGSGDQADDTVPTRGGSVVPSVTTPTTSFDVLLALQRIQGGLGQVQAEIQESPPTTAGCTWLAQALLDKDRLVAASEPAATAALIRKAVSDAQAVSDRCTQGRGGLDVMIAYDEVDNAINAVKYPR
jgi:hypothetical protein